MFARQVATVFSIASRRTDFFIAGRVVIGCPGSDRHEGLHDNVRAGLCSSDPSLVNAVYRFKSSWSQSCRRRSLVVCDSGKQYPLGLIERLAGGCSHLQKTCKVTWGGSQPGPKKGSAPLGDISCAGSGRQLLAVAAFANGLSPKTSTDLIPTSVTPRNPQKNHSGQHFWPNLFLGRWLKGLSVRSNSSQSSGFKSRLGSCPCTPVA